MQQTKEFKCFGNKIIDIQSIQTITRLSSTSYRVGMDNAEMIVIDGEGRCDKLLDILATRLGANFIE